jgi:hypothetical protein
MEPSAHAREEIALLETERAELETLFGVDHYQTGWH